MQSNKGIGRREALKAVAKMKLGPRTREYLDRLDRRRENMFEISGVSADDRRAMGVLAFRIMKAKSHIEKGSAWAAIALPVLLKRQSIRQANIDTRIHASMTKRFNFMLSNFAQENARKRGQTTKRT